MLQETLPLKEPLSLRPQPIPYRHLKRLGPKGEEQGLWEQMAPVQAWQQLPGRRPKLREPKRQEEQRQPEPRAAEAVEERRES